MPKNLTINGETIRPGERKIIKLSISKLYDFTEMNIPIEVVSGKKPGPVLFVCAAIHGDEINGTEIIRRLLAFRGLKKINGTLIAIPVVNVFGFNTLSRYLPDRRDLNRSFPGSANGSLAGQLANLFTKEILNNCTHGIDLHTAAIHRNNLPQVRGFIEDPEIRRLAFQFGVPVIINSNSRDGSLRSEAYKKNIPLLLYEGGEALRYNEKVIRIGLQGIKGFMREIGMLPHKPKLERNEAFISYQTYWVRSPAGGTFIPKKPLGDHVNVKEVLGYVRDPFNEQNIPVLNKEEGIVIGKAQLPLVNKGDAIYHIATFLNTRKVRQSLDKLEIEHD